VIWTEVLIEVPRSKVEPAAAILLRYCPLGFSESRLGRARAALRVYIAPGRTAQAVRRRLRADLAAAVPSARVSLRRVRDVDWRGAWKRYAHPIMVGRVVVLPTWWKRRPAAGRAVVRLDPQMAFGSGEHPTTQLCLAALDRLVGPGAVVIDVGTGSGILAIAAARFGARRVTAIDNDPLAVRVARRNVRVNRVSGRVAVRIADGLAAGRGCADVIVANLTAQTLPPVMPEARRRLRSDGVFVASGFGTPGTKPVTEAMRSAGLRPVAIHALRGWRAVEAVPA
jgi:ribosomal protein L11 methyltransferase